MKSPFPGMDPYVEPHWEDVHTSLIGDTRRALNRSLPQGLVARVEERVAVEADDQRSRRIAPDVRVFSPSTADPNEGAGGVVIEAPFKLVVDLDPILERFIRIIDQDGTLITVIEFLSPSNKQKPGLDGYLEKRDELLASGVHVVEIDLVRAGDWRAVMRPERCPADALSTYRATVRVTGAKPGGYLFPIHLREAMPAVPIPLRPGEQAVRLPLQALFEGVYEDGRYDQTLDYASPLDPPLHPEDADWADQLLRTAGKR
jgi:hypothetical protein